MIPSLVVGLPLLRFCSSFGLPASSTSVALGQTAIATPYVVRCVPASLVGVDRSLERAARILRGGRIGSGRHLRQDLRHRLVVRQPQIHLIHHRQGAITWVASSISPLPARNRRSSPTSTKPRSAGRRFADWIIRAATGWC